MSDAWPCQLCGTVIEADFDLCWRCGADRQGNTEPGFESYEETYKERHVDPSSRWTGTALIAACVAFLMALLFLVLYSFVAPDPDQVSAEFDANLRSLSLVLLGLAAMASACVSLGSFCAFVILCFSPLIAVHKTPPDGDGT